MMEVKYSPAVPARPDLVQIEMSPMQALELVQELEDVAQSFPEHRLLQGLSPYAQLYRMLKARLEENK